MDKPHAPRSPTRWQWSVRSLLALTTVVAMWLGAWSFHVGAGVFFTMPLFPACLLYILALAAKQKAEKVKIWTFCLLMAAGAALPPLIALFVVTEWNIDILYGLGIASFIGLALSTSYGIYLLLLESVLEALFGRTETHDL